MEFGVFILAQQRGYHQTSQQVINHSIQQTVMAEQAGFHSAWYAEHHFNNYGGTIPHPPTFLAGVARTTRQIHLGVAISVLRAGKVLELTGNLP